MILYDVIIIGAGPGGYVAAIRAANEGKKTALIEADELGGTCLNRGCIPSKVWLKHSEVIELMGKAKSWGIMTNTPQFDFKKMVNQKDNVIQTLRQGISILLQDNKIDVYNGFGNVFPGKRVIVEKEESKEELTAKNIIIATGSRPLIPPIEGLDSVPYHTTDTIFSIEKIPESIVIIGGGIIGVELANIFASLRTKVAIIELDDRIISTEDELASKELYKSLKKKGVNILLNHEVKKVQQDCIIKIQTINKNGDYVLVEAEEVLVAIGRSPNLDAIKYLDLEMNNQFIQVNGYLETSEHGIFAVGDVIGNFQLAHIASSEGLTAVENLGESIAKMNYTVIPRCIYTSPQVATVGKTEKELKEQNIAYRSHIFRFSSNGMALARDETDGFSKVFIDEQYGEILGAVMVGSHVTEMISQASAFMYLEGTVDELATMVQPHPSLSEVFMESANALLKKGIHTF